MGGMETALVGGKTKGLESTCAASIPSFVLQICLRKGTSRLRSFFFLLVNGYSTCWVKQTSYILISSSSCG